MPSSILPGIDWPAVPDAGAAQQLALLWQLDASQWWSPDRIEAAARRQLGTMLRHAFFSTEHYQDTVPAEVIPADGEAVSPEAWARIPILSRQEVIDAGTRLLSSRYPTAHGQTREVRTSGTTGQPVRLHQTELVGRLWRVFTLRDHLWHGRDVSAHLGAIRYAPGMAAPPDGVRGKGWGPATRPFAPDAPLSLLSVDSTTDEQVAWLHERDPEYLIVFPTVLSSILRALEASGRSLPSLREVRTVSEALPADLRRRCLEVLDVPLVDTYSAEEVGYIALQCPETEHYHVQSERVYLEVLRDDGTPCEPGEVGRVVLTDLHNHATPIVRYAIGDYAEAGPPCPCGRGLPVLRRIVGRTRNMLVYPDGARRFPIFTIACREAARYRELQVVQEDVTHVRIRLVPDASAPLDGHGRQALARAFCRAVRHDFDVTVEVVDRLGRTGAGKLEELVSKVGA